MDKIEGNKMIAEFMQLRKLSETEWINPVLACSTNLLNYHESWGWLMPVIEKISLIEYERYEAQDCSDDPKYMFIDTSYPRTFGAISWKNGKPEFMFRFNRMGLHISDKLIDAAWNAVIEFIEYKHP